MLKTYAITVERTIVQTLIVECEAVNGLEAQHLAIETVRRASRWRDVVSTAGNYQVVNAKQLVASK